jgi:two-component system response regulator ResD
MPHPKKIAGRERYMSGIKILIADDEDRMRKLVSDFLEKEGYRVIEADNGEKALNIFRNERDIDLVILDVMMPMLDGWSVCKEIRKDSQVPIIMLTARSEETD